MARKFTKRQTGAVFAVLIALYFGVVYGGELVFNPWASPLSGKPTLAGHWSGTAPLRGGDARVVMEVNSRRFSSCKNCPDFDGQIKVCGRDGAVEYDIWGGAEDRSGSRFHLTARATAGADDPGETVSGFTGDGEWPGEDTLTLSVDMATVGRDDGRRSSVREPTRFELTHVSEDEFDAAC